MLSRFRAATALTAVFLIFITGCAQQRPHDGVEVRKAGVLQTAVSVDAPLTPWNDAARFLAGMPGGTNSPLLAVRQTEHWQRYAQNMDELWRRFSVQRQPRIAAFSRSQLGGLRSPQTLWYPFSGPDVLFPEAFFPGSRTVLLSGLEGSEMLPDLATLNESEMNTALDGLYTSLTSALSFSFFITKDMRVDLQRTRLRGTLPVVLVFLARLGYDISGVSAVSLDAGGGVVAGHMGGAWPGYLINAAGKQILYFTGNLADFALRSDARYVAFAGTFGRCTTFLKSASYLMHTDDFSIIRGAILRQSDAILQDDSGLPLTAFDDSWSLDLYGRYTGVLDIFQSYHQPRLAEIYAAGGPNVHGIDFGIGYKHEAGSSTLILARKR
jgi:hypothetical protein